MWSTTWSKLWRSFIVADDARATVVGSATRSSAPSAPGNEPTPSDSPFHPIAALLAAARTTVSQFLELVSLEARRAGLSLVWMVMWAVVAALCLVTAWIGAMAALTLWGLSWGIHPILMLLGLAVANVLACGAALAACARLSSGLLFSATRSQLGVSASTTEQTA